MTVSYDDRRVWHNISTELKDELLFRLVSTLECLVCSEVMHVPFLAQCGHSFCYSCLNAWFETKVNCPTCRKDLEEAPTLNIQLKEMSNSITELIIDTLEDGLHREELRKAKQALTDEFEDASRRGLFGDAFKMAPTLVDKSDGVPRCGNCHWEAHGDVCLHCGSRFRVPRTDSYYDLEDGEAYNEDDEEVELYGIADDNNRYDSEDSFLDTRDVTQINGDRHVTEEDDLLLSGEEDSNSEGLWLGFRGSNLWDRSGDLEVNSIHLDSDDALGDVVERLHNRDVANYIDLSASEGLDSGHEAPRARRTTHIIDLDSD